MPFQVGSGCHNGFAIGGVLVGVGAIIAVNYQDSIIVVGERGASSGGGDG